METAATLASAVTLEHMSKDPIGQQTRWGHGRERSIQLWTQWTLAKTLPSASKSYRKIIKNKKHRST